MASALSDIVDVVALLLWGKAKRCTGCRNAALLQYLKDGKCPDCRGVKVALPQAPSTSYGGYDGEAD